MPNSVNPVLYIFSGLPGSGKSTLAQQLAGRLGATYLRIDTVEQALRDLCTIDVQGEGYGLSYKVAADNLRLGISVIADSCNPIELTRNEWENAARDAGARFINIEIVCSDKAEHQKRVETRPSVVPGLKLPMWKDVENRKYDSWNRERIIVDTSAKSAAESFEDLLSALSSNQKESKGARPA
jgi:predicted kinase